MTEKQIDKAIGEDPFVGFDICSVCNEVQEYGTMSDITEDSFDLICDSCLEKATKPNE